MKVLVGCEESQEVTKAFRALGYEAYSCDLQRCSGGHPEWHIQGDIFEILRGGAFVVGEGIMTDEIIIHQWDLFIGHPPCTYITYAGIGWFNIERYGMKAIQRHRNMVDAMEFFYKLWTVDIPFICLENPRGFIMNYIKYSQLIHPYYFGDECTKVTLLWLKNLPKLKHVSKDDLFDHKTHVFKGVVSKAGSDFLFGNHVWSLPKEERARLRSKTFPGIARAMAEQWGGYVSEQLKLKNSMNLQIIPGK